MKLQKKLNTQIVAFVLFVFLHLMRSFISTIFGELLMRWVLLL